jgi:lipoyl(octanoyl) transferase
MDLEPFGRINPCGYEGLQVTSMAKQLPGVGLKLELIGQRLMDIAASMLRV